MPYVAKARTQQFTRRKSNLVKKVNQRDYYGFLDFNPDPSH